MAVTMTHDFALGDPCPDFDLPDALGGRRRRDEIRGPRGLVLAFICNHCPYVIAIATKLAGEARDLAALGYGFAAISSNDAEAYPQDGFARMGDFARAHGFGFPYLHDEDQSLARALSAACTPEFYGFDANLRLRYHGRLDSSGRSATPGARRELHEAMRALAETGAAPADQVAAIGCSIKWKPA